MKRYLILIVVGTMVLASGLIVGCGQNQKKQDVEEILTYLDAVSSLEVKSLEAIGAVQDADMATYRAIQSRNEQAFLEAISNELDIQNGTLDIVNSDILFLESLAPPAEAQTLHNLMIESLQTTQRGLIKLSHGNTIIYEKLYARLFPTSSSQEYPDTAEEMRQGRQLIQEALSNWEQVGVEMDNLLLHLDSPYQ